MVKSNLASISRSVLFLFVVVLLHCSETQGDKPNHLHFYFHELLSGPNPTAIRVVNPPKNDSSFGAIGVIDDMLREGSDPSSKLIGRAQGLFSVSSMEDSSLATMVNLVFTDGPYNGSSLAIVGRLAFGAVMERGIVGGTGAFRMARGYILNKVVPNAPQGTAILECDAYIWN